MNRIFVFSVLVVLAVGCGLAGVAAADETANETANETVETVAVVEFDSGAQITDYDFRDGYVWIAVDADRRTTVEVADSLAGIDTEGATEIPVETEAVRPGGDTINIPVTDYNGGHAVTVTVDGQSVRLATEMQEGDQNPLDYFGGTSGVFSGIGLSMASSLAAAAVIIWRDNKGVVKGSP